MTSATALRIDTAIQPTSYIRLLMYVGLGCGFGLLAGLTSLMLWQYVLIAIVLVAVVGYLIVARRVLLHLSQPPLHQQLDRDWQLLIRSSRGDELWQGQLVKVHHYRWVINIEFYIIEPYQRSFSINIFRDQVSLEQWREFGILAHIHTDNVL